MNAAPLLEFRAVEKRYSTAAGEVPALSGVDFSIHAGEFVTVTGPSGSGKSTLLNLATLLDRPSAGDLRFEGNDVGSLRESERSRLRKHSIGMVFQSYHLLPERSVLDNVLFRFRYMDTPADEARKAAGQALELTGLAGMATRTARLLSGGEMQRVAIARAVAVPLRLLAADEPTGNLDAESAAQVMGCLRELNRAGTTVLLVTHNEALIGHGRRHLAFRHGRMVHDRALG
jgi:putative ABC transport system ATP-binding protein